ncbi:FUSC family protein [Streptomyces xiaopingdaonensis]|uniref:FUSC family protein n=1 Tax=Streptomyces xiaopingdaonensis TaxID=1565415 RepID=UPI0002F1FD3A|nr:aromatic acid exporter family protein [Streptomyces xiaopingdaonensis]
MSEPKQYKNGQGGPVRYVRERAARLGDRLQRVRNRAGPERETLLLLVKSAIAGIVAWALAQYVVGSPQPTYAPFTALLVVQSSAYRTIWQSVQYVGALLLGVFAAGAAQPLLGPNLLTFSLMLLVALVIGRWRRLGTQGVQVSVAAVFAYNALLQSGSASVWQIAGTTLLGAGVGLLVSLLILPPLRYNTAAAGVRQLSTAFDSLLSDVAGGLRDGVPERRRVGDWLDRARELDRTVAGARSAVESGAESVLYNPRRFLRGSVPKRFSGYRSLVEALARGGEHLRSISYALLRIMDDDEARLPSEEFLSRYADFLDALAGAPQALCEQQQSREGDGSSHDGEQAEQAEDTYEDALTRARELLAELHRSTPDSSEDPSAWPTYGVLLTDADRLVDEFSRARQEGAVHPSGS